MKHGLIDEIQLYEEYDAKGVLRSKRLMEPHFRLSPKDEIEELACAAGFKVKALYGDYSYSEYCEESSPFMIWLFE